MLLFAATVVPALAVEMPEACDAKDPTPNKPFDVIVGGEIMTDYIYRGVTLSAHEPSAAASIEIDRGPFYFGFNAQSVKLPTNPSAELTFTGGWCRKVLDNIKLNLDVTYFYYPGEIPLPPVISTSYGELQAMVSYDHPSEIFTLSAMYAYSPNYSNTGAWEHYVEGGLEIHMDKVFPNLLPKAVEWSLSGNVGHCWFGTQSADLGGFPLPEFTNWSVGISFDYDDVWTLGFTYSNTSLTQENCFVFTGDLGAAPGGVIDPITNPLGLRSKWCGAAFVGSLSYQFTPGK